MVLTGQHVCGSSVDLACLDPQSRLSGPRLRLSCDVASKQKSTTYDLNLWGGYVETMLHGYGGLSLGTGEVGLTGGSTCHLSTESESQHDSHECMCMKLV